MPTITIRPAVPSDAAAIAAFNRAMALETEGKELPPDVTLSGVERALADLPGDRPLADIARAGERAVADIARMDDSARADGARARSDDRAISPSPLAKSSNARSAAAERGSRGVGGSPSTGQGSLDRPYVPPAGNTLERASAEAHSPRALYYMAEVDGVIAGQTMVTLEWSDWRDGFFWWIQSVYVAPDFRRLGVFRALHQHIRGEARSRPDVCGLRLYVHQQNTRAIETYRRLGMHATDYLLFEEEFPERVALRAICRARVCEGDGITSRQ